MIKLREPFSQKIHLHIRQNMLQRLWDQYVPTSSAEYERIQLVYLKDALGQMGEQPQQVQLLLQLILKNKMMQLNLVQYPTLVKVGQKQMERRLRQIERYYTAQLKSCDFAMFRTVRQYFTLLDQAEESSRRYQSWLKDYQEIEKQREEYRLLSLFSVKLREFLTEHSVDTLRTMEREFVDLLSKTEYRALAEELIWQEKPELIAYLRECNQTQCEKIFKTLKTNVRTKEVLSMVEELPVKEKLIAAVEQLEQKEFCLFYHQVTEAEDVSPQMVIWKESKNHMLRVVDELEPEALQQMWKQIEEVAHPLEQRILRIQGKDVWEQNTAQMQETDVLIQNMLQVQEKVTQFVEQSTLRIQEKDVMGQNTLQTLERELVYSLSETEYQTFAEALIWQEKPRLITYLRECSTALCEEIINVLEKDTHMRELLTLVLEQPAKERLITAVERMEQKAFCLFYHQVEKVEDVNPQMVIWKESKTEMLHRMDSLETETLQHLWSQMENAAHLLERDILRVQLKHFLSETEYQTFTEELIWQEKSELIAYLRERTIAQCEEIVNALEKNVSMSEVLALASEQPVKEKLIALAERLEQKEFSLFYHQVMKIEDVNPQMVIWKESKTEMLHAIDRLETQRLQQMWNQIEKTNNVLEEDTLRMQEKELVYSLLETEYQTFAEELIWKEKPEFVAYLKECSKTRCKEIVRELEKDTQMSEILASVQKQSVRKKLVGAARKLKQQEFGRFYWQVVELKDVNPPVIIWKKNRAEMLRSLEEMNTEHLQEVWAQMEAVPPVKGMKHILSEKMVYLQNQYQQREIQSFQEQITTILKENDLEKITDVVDVEQLIQDFSTAEYTEKEPAESTKEPELLVQTSSQLTVRDEVYRVIQRLEQEREIRRERIDRQEAQAVAIYQDAYYQVLETEDLLLQQQENVERLVEQTFLERHQEKFTREEIQDIREWSRALFEVCFVEQETSLSSEQTTLIQSDNPKENPYDNQDDSQNEKSELVYMFEQINHYMEEQHGTGKRLILNWQENLSKDERIQEVLVSVRKLEEKQRQKLIQYLAEMFVIWQEVSLSERVRSNREANTTRLLSRTESAELPMQELSMQELPLQEELMQEPLIQRSFLQESLMEESLIQGNLYEFAERVLRTGDREIARKLLQIENREFAEKLLQIEDREIVRRLLQVGNRELVEKLLQDNDIPMPDVSYRNLWEWGEILLFHPEYEQEQEDADIISVSQQALFSSDDAQQEDIQTQVIRHQIAMAKDRNHLQRLIRQINHQADIQLVYADAQLKLPQVQTLLQYIRQLDEKQYGVLVKELAQITKIQKIPYDKPETTAETYTEVPAEEEKNFPKPRRTLRTLSYPVLVQRIQEYEKQHHSELYREIEKTGQKIFPKMHVKTVTSYEENETEYGLTLFERIGTEYGQDSYEEIGMEYGQVQQEASSKAYETELFETFGIEYAQAAAYGKTRQENRYQSQKLEYSAQKVFSSEEDQQRKELRMQQETAQIKSVQEQLDQKLKEVEHQLKKVEDSTKVKQDVSVFAEQVKWQLYEELHVEKLRRGLV